MSIKHQQYLRGLIVQALAAINTAAHSLRDGANHSAAVRRLFGSKDDLLSLVLELELPGVRVAWQRQQYGNWLIVASLGDEKCFHCVFDRLSVGAQIRIVNEIGSTPVV